jgi:hypothetical protein
MLMFVDVHVPHVEPDLYIRAEMVQSKSTVDSAAWTSSTMGAKMIIPEKIIRNDRTIAEILRN